MEIVAITVSTNYHEILQTVLEGNLKHFKEWVIITSENDKKTIQVVVKEDSSKIKLIFHDFKNGGKSAFDKGGALKKGQEYAHSKYAACDGGGSTGFLILDSDIRLPSNFREFIEEKIPSESRGSDILYHVECRKDYSHIENLWLEEPESIYNHPGAGFFQLYFTSPNTKTNLALLPTYEPSNTCGNCDNQFRTHFKHKKMISGLFVDHLGLSYINWGGRVDEPGSFASLRPTVLFHDFDTNSQTLNFIKSLNENRWHYEKLLDQSLERRHDEIIDEYIQRLKKYHDSLVKVEAQNNKIFIIAFDPKNTLALRSPKAFTSAFDFFSEGRKKVVFCSQLLLDYTFVNSVNDYDRVTYKGILSKPIPKYWKKQSDEPHHPDRKILCPFFVAGKAKDLIQFLEYIKPKPMSSFDFESMIASASASFVENDDHVEHVYVDSDAKLFHATCSNVSGGTVSTKHQLKDSPSLSQLFGRGCFFMHFPMTHYAKPQMELYNQVIRLISSEEGCSDRRLRRGYNFEEHVENFATSRRPQPLPPPQPQPQPAAARPAVVVVNAPLKIKVSVCLWGLCRSTRYTVDSFKENVVKVLKESIQSPEENVKVYLHTNVFGKDKIYTNEWSGDNAETFKNFDEDWKLYNADEAVVENEAIFDSFDFKAYRTHEDYYVKGDYREIDNILKSLYSLNRVTDLMVRRSSSSSGGSGASQSAEPPHYVIFCRSDLKFETPLPIKKLVADAAAAAASDKNQKFVFTPNNHMWPVNDRMGFMTYETAIAYGTRFKEALSYSKKVIFHPESFLYLWMLRNGVKIVPRNDLESYLVRSSGKYEHGHDAKGVNRYTLTHNGRFHFRDGIELCEEKDILEAEKIFTKSGDDVEVTDGYNPVKGKKISICFWGLFRSSQFTHGIFEKNIKKVLTDAGASVSVLIHTSLFGKDVSYSNPWSKDQNVKGFDDNWKMYKPDAHLLDDEAEMEKILNLHEYRTHPDFYLTGYREVDNAIKSLYSLKKVTSLLRSNTNDTTTTKPDYVIFIRPDISLLDGPLSLDLFKDVNERQIVSSSHNRWPVNDRFAIVTYENALIYGNRFDGALSFSKKAVFVPEVFLFFWLKKHKIEIVPRKLNLYLVRSNGECCSGSLLEGRPDQFMLWSNITNHLNNGIKIEKADEYMKLLFG